MSDEKLRAALREWWLDKGPGESRHACSMPALAPILAAIAALSTPDPAPVGLRVALERIKTLALGGDLHGHIAEVAAEALSAAPDPFVCPIDGQRGGTVSGNCGHAWMRRGSE